MNEERFECNSAFVAALMQQETSLCDVWINARAQNCIAARSFSSDLFRFIPIATALSTREICENLDDTKNSVSRYLAQEPIDLHRIEDPRTRWRKIADNESVITSID